MKPFLYAFLTLLVSGCVIYKKQASPTIQQIVNIDSLPFSSSDAKCILLKSLKTQSWLASDKKYYYFFPEEHIYMYYYSGIFFPELGYYNFEPKAADGNSYLYLECATSTTKNISVKNKYLKKSLDSIYLHFNLATIEGFPLDRKEIMLVFDSSSGKKATIIDTYFVDILKNQPDSSEFIIALKRDNDIKQISILLNLGNYYEIDEQHNYYEITGATCCLNRNSSMPPMFWDLAKKDTLIVKMLNKNTYEFRQAFEDTSLNLKQNCTWQNADSLYDYEKKYLYMLPTFIKILECSGTYPRK